MCVDNFTDQFLVCLDVQFQNRFFFNSDSCRNFKKYVVALWSKHHNSDTLCKLQCVNYLFLLSL